jgi:hypothetical protein
LLTSPFFSCSHQRRPALHELRLYGPKNSLIVSQDSDTVIKLSGRRHPSYLAKFLPPINMAGQYLGNLASNARAFLTADFHMKSGMKYLIESFYDSIVRDTAPPIPYREIVLTADIMDAIFHQLRTPRPSVRPGSGADGVTVPSARPPHAVPGAERR